MPKKKAPTKEQRKRAEGFAGVLAAALANDAHPGWALVNRTLRHMARPKTQFERVQACVDELRFMAKLKAPWASGGIDPVALDNLLFMLREHDAAFEELTSQQATAILSKADLAPRTKKGGNGRRGPWNALARMSQTCGAFGCRPSEAPDAKKTITRWKNSVRRKSG